MSFTLSELSKHVAGKLKGDPQVKITSAASLEKAGSSEIAYIGENKYLHLLERTNAGAVVISEEFADKYSGHQIVVKNPRASFARIATLLNPTIQPHTGIDDSASVDKSVQLGDNVSIAKNAVIEPGVVLGSNVYIGTGSYIGKSVKIGNDSSIRAHAVIWDLCEIGERCVLFSGCVIGSDGFGYEMENGKWVKIPQLGRVLIGDDVEIGANATVDRGALDETIIGNDVKIDNLVQIAHNVTIGDHTVIAAGAGIAGSAKIGKRCSIGGLVGIYGHLEIVDDVMIGGCAVVTKSITKPGTYSSALRAETIEKWQRNVVRFNQLDDIYKELTLLKKQVKDLRKG